MIDGLDDDRPTTHRLAVSFEMYPLKDEEASEKEGRPIFNDHEFIRIMVPGDKQNTVHRPVRATDKREYGRQYEAWKRGAEEVLTGTPLKEWSGVGASQVKELEYWGVRTVEQLANLSDGNTSNIGPIQALKKKANDFVEQSKGNAPLLKIRSELESRDNEIETLKRALKEQGEKLDSLSKKQK